MSTVLITYRLREGAVEEHLRLLAEVHDELRDSGIERVRWTSFRRDDGHTFLELVETDQPGRFSSLRTWPAFRATLDERCEAPPELADLDVIART